MENFIDNKVAKSGLITISLEEFHQKGERVLFDIKPLLWQGAVLKEKDFRSYIKNHDWAQYRDSFVAITCSVDAIVPNWAYMLIAIALQSCARKIVFGNLEDLEKTLYKESIDNFNLKTIKDKRVLVKGCGDLDIPIAAFVHISTVFLPAVKSLMFGEACSNVPLFKK